MEPNGGLILLADDDEQLSEMLLFILREKGYRVVNAIDGQMAIQMVVDFQPDLVILDVNMPKVNGFEVCRHIKSNEILRKTKVIMFTIRAQAEDYLKSSELGADVYLKKPVETKMLLDTIKVLLKPK
ncbi:MAG TPA: response regulator [Elusimicrobiota bacterium]|nr:response regulator [Elusimicrobiota bacterium]